MLPKPEVFRRAKRWLALADEDLRLARHGLTLPEAPPYRLIAYHAQQCVEKHLKAYLTFRGVDFPYTHNIAHFLELCSTQRAWPEELSAAEELSPFAVSARYPGDEEDVTGEEALRAIEVSVRVRQAVREALENEGLTLEDAGKG